MITQNLNKAVDSCSNRVSRVESQFLATQQKRPSLMSLAGIEYLESRLNHGELGSRLNS